MKGTDTMNKFKLIYGSYSGLEKKAIEIVSEEISDYIDYPLPALKSESAEEDDLKGANLVIVGTKKSNTLIAKLINEGVIKEADKPEGYSLKVTKSIFDDESQMIIICGYDEQGVLYGAVDFFAYYIPYTENNHNHMHYFNKIFTTEELREYENISSPSVKQRGIWTWGHVIYDYKKYIRNMVRLKMNTLIVWNDYVPVNIKDIIKEAHENGVKIFLGFSWGWNEARPENGGLNIADEETLGKIKDIIIKNYENDYANLDIDGIYFQSFTETCSSEINNIVIAERVVKLVNQTANEIFEKKPDLLIMFGLHASSVFEKLEYIKETDKRIMIVWEDCGAFPYSYTPEKIDGFDKTCELNKKIAVLRGKDDKFGIVSKGLICLDWTTFKHQQGKFIMGQQSKEFIKRRKEEKKKIWKYVDSYWVKNAKYAYDMVKLLKEANENTLITALIEDGMFEEQIYLSAASYAEMLWDTEKNAEDIILKASLRKDVEH